MLPAGGFPPVRVCTTQTTTVVLDSRSMFLTAPHKRKAENASLEDDKVLEQLMKSKFNADDDDDENTPRVNAPKKQKSEVTK